MPQTTPLISFAVTDVTGGHLADPVLELVAFATFGTYVAICAEVTIGYAGKAGIVTPVRIQSPGAVRPTATLVKKTYLSIFICGGGGGGEHIRLVIIKLIFNMPLVIWNSILFMRFTKKIWTLPKVKIISFSK